MSEPEARRRAVVERLRKLLALAASSNPHEAETARRLADELMTAEQISESEVMEGTHTVGEYPIDGLNFKLDWRLGLLTAVAMRYRCKTLRVFEGLTARGIVVGLKANAKVVEHVFRYFEGEVRTRAMEHLASAIDHETRGVLPNAALRARCLGAFCRGATISIQDRVLDGNEDIQIEVDEVGASKSQDNEERDRSSASTAITTIGMPPPVEVAKYVKNKKPESFGDAGARDRWSWSTWEIRSYKRGVKVGMMIPMPGQKAPKAPEKEAAQLASAPLPEKIAP